MNKTIKIILITFLSLLVVILSTVLLMLLDGKNVNFISLNKQSMLIYEKEYTDNIDLISIDINSTDVYVKKSSNSSIKVKIYGVEKENGNSYIKNNKLTITKEESNKCFGICIYNDNKIELYLPENMNSKLLIKSSSGDVFITDFSNLNLEVSTDSGDIKISKLNSLDAYTDSGDISINSIDSVNIYTKSGDIVIKNFNIKENSNIETTSGDVVIFKLSESYVDASSISGDVKIGYNNRKSEKELKIKSTSGDIVVR